MSRLDPDGLIFSPETEHRPVNVNHEHVSQSQITVMIRM